ncbi:MAG: 3-phosphoserine/phosphohydroxythreonine transaminase, partial [Oceanospirillum sp.]|nr:3-phosphoserine/phosphohydroxythreonine transaminase [Oceanospirillum sp.]
MTRKYNFCAGPAALPEAVLVKAQAEMLDWQGRGLSVMEMSHRSKEFVGIAEQAEQDLRDLLQVPANYKVLFMQGGASSQFAMVPLNLLGKGGTGNYVKTGVWSKKAIAEAKRYNAIHLAADTEGNSFTSVPAQNEIVLSDDAAYLHFTSNETIGGLQFDYLPEVGDLPLVCDMSSDILAAPLNVGDYGVIYAGAQKNIGPAGL